MAEVITRFKLETTQYESKLRDASKSMRDLLHVVNSAGGDFKSLTEGQKQLAASFGTVGAGATNARDKVKELVTAYNDVARQYNILDKDLKNSDIGKTIASQMEVLQRRISEAKNELYGMGETTKSTGGVLDELSKRLTVNLDAFKLLSVGVQAAKAALDVAKDAFFASEQNVDEWGRTVQSATSIYDGFLNALNTGDLSGFLSNIGEIVRAARSAYDALDELQTFSAFNQKNVAQARRGMTESIVDFREGKGTKESVRAAGDAYKKELESRLKLENDAYEAAVADLAKRRGVSVEGLRSVLTGTYEQYKAAKSVEMTGTKLNVTGGYALGAPVLTETKAAANDVEKLGQMLRNLNDTELKSIQALGAQADRTGEEIAGVDRQLVRVLNGRRYGTGVSRSTPAAANKEVPPVDEWRTFATQLDRAQLSIDGLRDVNVRVGVPPGQLKEWEELHAAMQRPLSPLRAMEEEARQLQAALMDASTPEEWQRLNAELTAVSERMASFKGQSDSMVRQGKDIAESWQKAASAVASIGTALQSIEDPAAKVAGIVAQAVATVAGTFAASLKGTFTPWDWIAAAASGTATMVSTIAAIKKATAGSYAEGGIVPGHNYTDGLIANVSSGELILNRAQTNNIASQLQEGGGTQPAQADTTISADQLRVVIRNGARRRGMTVNEFLTM